MTMLARKILQVETGWEKAETRLKTWIYTLAHELLQAQITSSILYKLLLFIEMLQFLWYAIHPNFSFLWTADVATWLREAVKYFQFDAVLNQDNESIFVITLYLVFGIQMAMLLTAVVTTYKLTRSKKKTSTIVTYSLKALSGYSMLMTTFFALPIFNIYIASIICYDDDFVHGTLTCYSGVYFLHLVVGIIGLILHFVVMIYLNSLYIDLNPWSAIPFASPQSKLNLIKLLLKIILTLYITLDYEKGFTKEFIAIYGVIWIFILILRYRQTPFYNRSVFRFVLGMDSIVLWACLVSNVHAFVDTDSVDDLGLFFLFFGFPLFAYAFITITERRKIIYRRLILKNLKKDTDVEMYINGIMNLIENRDKPAQRMALEGLLKYHVKHCIKKDGECSCSTLSKDYVKEEEAPEKLWYTWIKHIIIDVLERFPKSTRLHMLYAYIQREKLQNKFKALFEMMITEENKPNVEEEFSIFSYKNIIEEEMIENDAKNSESKGVDVNIIVDFQNKFVDFQAAVENAVDLHLEFWRELLENNPDIQKLQSLGSKITHSLEETSAEFRKLNDINPNHIKMLQIYGNYLKDIVNDEVEGQRTLEKADYVEKSAAVNKQFIDNDHLKYGENSSTCLLTVSGNLTNLGIIKNVNNEITRILGYSKQDLIGQNISRIIPKIIGDLHDGFMRGYFESSDPKVIGHERLVYPLNKEGYIVPCSLMIKVLPNLDEGIRLVGFLKDVDKDGAFAKGSDFESEEKVHHIMYSGDTGAIHGITHSCKRGFGIPASLVSGANANNDFTMDIIFPDLLSHTLEDLKAPAGVVTTLDTSSLQQNYLLGDSESDESEYGENEEEEKEKRFRKTNVRVGLAEDTDYQDVNIKVLRFVEITEEGGLDPRPSLPNDPAVQETAKPEAVEDNSKVEPDPNRSAEYERSDKESSVSGGDAINDDIKQLKDFKALISEKTVPKSIKLLSRAVLLLLVLLIVFSSLILKFRLDQTGDFETGITAIRQAYRRTDLMADINYNIRRLERLARYQLYEPSGKNYDTYQNDIKAYLIYLIDQLSTVQFNIMRSTEVLKNQGASTIDSNSFTLEHSVDGGTRTEDRIYTDSVFQYITAASSIRNSTISNIISTLATDSTPKNFFFVRRNGLGPLRRGSEEEALNFYNFYLGTADDYSTKFKIIMIVAILVIALSDMILIPIVFSVHKTNDRVLAFFGYIPLSEITELAAKCERYMQNYLEDHKEQRYNSFEEDEEEEGMPASHRTENVDGSYLESQGNQEEVVEGDSINPDTSMQLDVSEKIEVSPVGRAPKQAATLNVPTNQSGKRVNTVGAGGKSGRDMMTSSENTALKSKQDNMMLSSQDHSKVALNKNQSVMKQDNAQRTTMKDDEKKKEDLDNEEAANDRSQKLLNSRNNRRASVVIQFVLIAAIFGIYFLLDFLLIENNFLSNVKQTLEHLRLTSERIPLIRYLNAFTLEEISENNYNSVYAYPGQPSTNLREYYKKLISTNEQTIQDPQKLDFPGEFDTYLGTFTAYNDGDLCAAYFRSLGMESTCQSLAEGLLTRGLTLATTTVSLNSDDVLKDFNTSLLSANTPDAVNSSKINAINSAKFNKSDDIMNKTMPAFSKLLDDYIVAYNDFLNQSEKVEGIKFAMFLLFCFLVFFALWQPYLKNLKDKIFRTKGMLNMIPMDIISKNENLRTQFLSGNILQAVK